MQQVNHGLIGARIPTWNMQSSNREQSIAEHLQNASVAATYLQLPAILQEREREQGFFHQPA